jgi:hypothetical protein
VGSPLLLGILKIVWTNLLPNGVGRVYGITALYLQNKKPSWRIYCCLRHAGRGKIKPLITTRLPPLAVKANELLENGKTSGNIALVAPELL